MMCKFKYLYLNYGFECLMCICILFIIIYGIYRNISGYKGTWSSKDDIIMTSAITSDIKLYSQPVFEKQSNKYESKGESECRRVLQKIFNKPFNSVRPDFLRNPVTGNNHNLELDCYDPELKLAVEYNGEQHYKYVPYFHKNKEAFHNQKYRDLIKRQMCRDNGVHLIEVPNTIKIGQIEQYLLNQLRNTRII